MGSDGRKRQSCRSEHFETACPNGRKPIAKYHTHPPELDPGAIGAEIFSDADRFTARELGIPSYLGTPNNDVLKYIPSNASPTGKPEEERICQGCTKK